MLSVLRSVSTFSIQVFVWAETTDTASWAGRQPGGNDKLKWSYETLGRMPPILARGACKVGSADPASVRVLPMPEPTLPLSGP